MNVGGSPDHSPACSRLDYATKQAYPSRTIRAYLAHAGSLPRSRNPPTKQPPPAPRFPWRQTTHVQGHPRYDKFAIVYRSAIVLHAVITATRFSDANAITNRSRPAVSSSPNATRASDGGCGPDVDAQLTAVLTDTETYYRGLNPAAKYVSCNAITFPVTAAMAWDIIGLFLPCDQTLLA